MDEAFVKQIMNERKLNLKKIVTNYKTIRSSFQTRTSIGYILLIFILILNDACAQSIDFAAYNKIKNEDFKAYVDLFPDRNLPISSVFIRELDVLDLGLNNISQEFIAAFLKLGDQYAISELYILENENGEKIEVYGDFLPLYKLPTDGDYVLLLIYQYDVRYEWSNKALLLTYDLDGNFIEAVGNGYLLAANENYVHCELNDQLELSFTYVLDIENTRAGFWSCKPCTKRSQTETYQILPSGMHETISSTVNDEQTFRYTGEYFEKQE